MRASQILVWSFCGAWLLPQATQAADFWLKDPDTGCEIWNNEAPTEEDLVSWSGECADGKASGDGVLVWMKGDELFGRYDGQMEGGKLNGEGFLILRAENGEGYERLRGVFKDGEAEGQATYVGANGDYYEGKVRGGKLHGDGIFSDALGNTYEGRFENDLPGGLGHSTAANGEEYLGEFVDGQRQGTGLLIEANGSVYVGAFEDGFASGAGRLETDGGLHIGRFSKSIPDGPGTFIAADDGTIYQGLFVAGKADGQFLVTKPDGTQATETYKDGEKVE